MGDENAGGFGVLPNDLRSAASSISTATGRAEGFDLSGIGEGTDAYGHRALAAAVTRFCDCLHGAVVDFRESAAAHHDRLRTAADAYAERDDDVRNRL